MKKYFAIRIKYAPKAFLLDIAYSFDDVPDPLIIKYGGRVPDSFLNNFQFRRKRGASPEDLLANTIGWMIVSPRLASVLKTAKNASDLQPLELPSSFEQREPAIKGYCVLGVKRSVACLDDSKSDLAWGTGPKGERYIKAMYRPVIQGGVISPEYDIFNIEEYPMYTVLSAELATRIATLRPTGFVYEEIESGA